MCGAVMYWLRPLQAYLGSEEHYLDRLYTSVSIAACLHAAAHLRESTPPQSGNPEM